MKNTYTKTKSQNETNNKMLKEYNGHPSYRHWNASLWFGNDQISYEMVMNAQSANSFIKECEILGIDKTGDEVPLSKRVLKYVWKSFHNKI